MLKQRPIVVNTIAFNEITCNIDIAISYQNQHADTIDHSDYAVVSGEAKHCVNNPSTAQ